MERDIQTPSTGYPEKEGKEAKRMRTTREGKPGGGGTWRNVSEHRA